MARSSKQADESLMMLVSAFDNLVKAGEQSVIMAYRFGAVVNALHGFSYSYAEMGRQVDRSGTTVYGYRKFFLRYHSENEMLQAAVRLGTYDIGRLARDGSEDAGYHYGYQCTNCGALDQVKKVRELNEDAARVSADT